MQNISNCWSIFLGGLMIPLAAWPDAAQPWLAVLPFRHFFSEPARALLSQSTTLEWASSLCAALLWCGAFLLVARFAFARGRLRYTGPGM